METYEVAVERFLKVADWLTDEHQPMVTGLRHLAVELDDEFRAATYAQYGLTFRYLARMQPTMVVEDEDDEDLSEL